MAKTSGFEPPPKICGDLLIGGPLDGLLELQGLCDRNVDFGGVVQRRQVNKPDPIRERIVE